MSFRTWVEVVVEGAIREAKSGKMRAESRDGTSAELQGLKHACPLPAQLRATDDTGLYWTTGVLPLPVPSHY